MMLMKSAALVLASLASVTSKANSWAQVTTYDLKQQSYALSVCSATSESMTFALRYFNTSVGNASIDDEMAEANTILANFIAPRQQLKNNDIVNEFKKIGDKKISRNDILYQIMINAPSTKGKRRRLASSECSGHGHICGSSKMCHCDPGYMRGTGFQECVKLPEIGTCDEASSTQIVFNIRTAGEYVLYTDVPLAYVQGSLQLPSTKTETLTIKKCLHGCSSLEVEETPKYLKTTLKWLYTIIGSLIVCGTALVGILVLLLKKKLLMKLIDWMTCFAAGTLLATVVLHLLPEAGKSLESEEEWVQGISICAGVLVGIFVEQGLHMFLHAKGAGHGTCHGGAHLNENDNETCHQSLTSPHLESGMEKYPAGASKGFWNFAHVEAVAWIVAIGDFAHAFTDGILIAVAFSSSNPTTGWLITMAICLHEVPHRIGDFFIFLKAGMSIGQACFVNFLASLSSLIGALALLVVGDIAPAALGVILSVGGGVLLFLAMSELIPPMLQEMKLKAAAINLLFFIVGIVVIALSMANGSCSCGHAH